MTLLAETEKVDQSRLQQLLTLALESKASDLHLVVGHPPCLRINTVLHPIEGQEVVTQEVAQEMVREMSGGDEKVVELHVTGKLVNGTDFAGFDSIKVIDKHKKKSGRHGHLQNGKKK